MSFLRRLSVILLIVGLTAFLMLFAEMLGSRDPGRIIAYTWGTGVGLIGSCLCSLIRALSQLLKKDKKHELR